MKRLILAILGLILLFSSLNVFATSPIKYPYSDAIGGETEPCAVKYNECFASEVSNSDSSYGSYVKSYEKCMKIYYECKGITADTEVRPIQNEHLNYCKSKCQEQLDNCAKDTNYERTTFCTDRYNSCIISCQSYVDLSRPSEPPKPFTSQYYGCEEKYKVCVSYYGEESEECRNILAYCKEPQPMCGNELCEKGEVESGCAQDCAEKPGPKYFPEECLNSCKGSYASCESRGPNTKEMPTNLRIGHVWAERNPDKSVTLWVKAVAGQGGPSLPSTTNAKVSIAGQEFDLRYDSEKAYYKHTIDLTDANEAHLTAVQRVVAEVTSGNEVIGMTAIIDFSSQIIGVLPEIKRTEAYIVSKSDKDVQTADFDACRNIYENCINSCGQSYKEPYERRPDKIYESLPYPYICEDEYKKCESQIDKESANDIEKCRIRYNECEKNYLQPVKQGEFIEDKIGLENGCKINGRSLPFGARTEGKYCDWDGALKSQKEPQEPAENSFECKSNFASNGECLDIREQLNLLQRVVDFLSKIFR